MSTFKRIGINHSFSSVYSLLEPDNTLKILGGTYTEKLNISQNGTADNPIVIMPVEGEHVIIDGKNSTGRLIKIAGNYVEVHSLEIFRSNQFGVELSGQYLLVKNLIVHEVVSHGIYIIGQHIVVSGCTVYRTVLENEDKTGGWGSAIKVRIGGQDIAVQNNIVYYNYGEGIGITRGIDCYVKDNVCYDNFAKQIYIDNSINVTVEGNFVYCTDITEYLHPDGRKADGIGVSEENYTGWGAQLDNILVKNNILAHCHMLFSYWSNLPDGAGLKNTTIIYNTFETAM